MDSNDKQPTGLDRDTYHELLSNSRRRSIITHLAEHGSLDKGELATLVTADEVDKSPEDVDSDERKRVVVSLSQQHLDTLGEHDIIEIERSIVSQGPNFDEIASGLESRQTQPTQDIHITIENANIEISAELESDDFDLS